MTEPFTDAQAEGILRKLSDRWWRLNNLYWIHDKFGRKILFKPNEVQCDLDDNLHQLNVVLKSRQHGLTTWACIRALDLALFKANTQAGIVAHTAGDAAKFFRKKVLVAYDNLPTWLKQLRPTTRRDMKDGVLELSNGSSIEVSVSHRGGTLQFLHISEYGPMCAMFPQRAQEVATGALNAIAPGNIVVIESTAYGAAGDFYERCQTAMELQRQIDAGKAKLTSMDYRFHFYGWYMDPINEMDPEDVAITEEDQEYFAKIEGEMGITLSDRQRAWYVKKAADQRDKMTREHPSTPTEAFEASTEGAYYGKEMALASKQGRILDLPIMPGVPVHTFWDIGRSDNTCIWFMQENGPWLDFIDYYEMSGHGVTHFAKILKEKDYLYGRHHWPHDGDNEEWGASKSRRQTGNDLGIKPIVIVPRISDVTEGIDMVRNMLPRCRFDKTRCGPMRHGTGKGGLEALRRYHKEWNEKTETYGDLPKHDWASDGADAIRTCAQGYVSSSGRKAGDRGQTVPDSWRTA